MLRAPLLALLFATACATAQSTARSPKVAPSAASTPSPPAKYPDLRKFHGAPRLFEWAPYARETFDRARREGRFILLHGAAEWCHFCHVMENVTYRNPEVVRILRERFVTIRVDVDAHPDIEERYGEWGWPATILLSPSAEELGKFRGYLPPDEMLAALAGIRAEGPQSASDPAFDAGAPVSALPWIHARTALELESYYDPKLGGWGRRHKSPLGENAEFELLRSARGVPGARDRAVFSLESQRRLMDPVWGGLYQYSVGGTWNEPHYEKLMTIQAANLEAYARAFALTGRADFRRDLDGVAGYVRRFLTSPEGAFYANQDADLGSHDPEGPFVDGHDYYGRAEPERLAAGLPWIDTRVSGFENGLMIAALVAAWEATAERSFLEQARRAADHLERTLVDERGAVFRTETPEGVRHLSDTASLGRAYARLARATRDTRYLALARRIEGAMTATLFDATSRSYFAHTEDPGGTGVFARRRRPFVHNVLAARFLAELATVSGEESHRERARQVLASIATPSALAAQGRLVGGFLLAMEEARVAAQ